MSDLLLRVARCPIVADCLAHPHEPHPCREIVLSQGAPSLATHQVPEPWTGHIATAPILFVSSNPSISMDEEYPSGSWDDSDIIEFFEGRFDGDDPRIRGGIYGRGLDGTYPKRGTSFWIAVRARAAELLQCPPTPGEDYVLTEVVHCKSLKEAGVPSALRFCAGRYLGEVIAASGARVIVILGTAARDAFHLTFGSAVEHDPFPVLSAGGQPRSLAFLPHPASRAPAKTLSGCLPVEHLNHLRRLLQAP